jgi:hypothetical protein
MVMIGIAAFGWGFLAGSYAGAHSPELSQMSIDKPERVSRRSPQRLRTEATLDFLGHAIEQLPNLPVVISWHFKNRIWLPILIIVLEVGALLGAYGMKKVEKELEAPNRRRRER